MPRMALLLRPQQAACAARHSGKRRRGGGLLSDPQLFLALVEETNCEINKAMPERTDILVIYCSIGKVKTSRQGRAILSRIFWSVSHGATRSSSALPVCCFRVQNAGSGGDRAQECPSAGPARLGVAGVSPAKSYRERLTKSIPKEMFGSKVPYLFVTICFLFFSKE